VACSVILSAGCGSAASESQKIASLAERYVQASKSLPDESHVDKLAAFYAEDAVIEDVPMKERVEGRTNIRAVFREDMGISVDSTSTVDYVVTGDDFFIVQERLTQGKGEFATTITMLCMYKVRDGLITHAWEFYPSDAPWLEYYR
jgi:hypothetical protein